MKWSAVARVEAEGGALPASIGDDEEEGGVGEEGQGRR
jgi:hypothetical protein